MVVLKERRLEVEKLNGRCELNDSDDLEGKQERLSVRWVVDGDVDRVLRVNLAADASEPTASAYRPPF